MRAHGAVASGGMVRIHHRTREHAMSQLRLRLDELAVETFDTGADERVQRGTVDAHGATAKPLCIPTLKTDLTCCPCTPMI
jgi:hypothetical protein